MVSVLIITRDKELSLSVSKILNRMKINYQVVLPDKWEEYVNMSNVTHVIYGDSYPPMSCNSGIPENIDRLKIPKLYVGSAMIEYAISNNLEVIDSHIGLLVQTHPTNSTKYNRLKGYYSEFSDGNVCCCWAVNGMDFEYTMKQFMGDRNTLHFYFPHHISC